MCLCYSGPSPRWSSDDARRVSSQVIFELKILHGVQFLVRAGEGARPDYYFWSLWSDHATEDVLFQLLTTLVSMLGHCWFQNIAEKMPIGSLLVASA